MSMRQTVGGAQKLVTPARSISAISRAGVEARVVVDEDGRLGVPGREEVGPGVLGPAGRGDVQMHVAGLEADPVHGRQMPDGVRGVGVLDELGAGGGARGEVEHQRVVGVGRPVRRERPRARRTRPRTAASPRGRRPPRSGCSRPGTSSNLPVSSARTRTWRDPAAVDPVAQVGGAEQRGGGDDDGAELHRGEGRLPQLGLVAEHDEEAVLGADPQPAQPVGDPVGAGGHLGEGHPGLGAVLLDDVQGGAVVPLRDDVEPVQGPVEALGARPAETLVRAVA